MLAWKVQLKGTGTLWRSRSDPSDEGSLCGRVAPPCFEVGFPIEQIGVVGPLMTRGAQHCFTTLVNQLAASQETYFNYHKSLGLFPSILSFNGLCM